MRLPSVSPSVDRLSPSSAPAGRPGGRVRPRGLWEVLSGEEVELLVTFAVCPVKSCSTSTDCAGNGACKVCNGGLCKTS